MTAMMVTMMMAMVMSTSYDFTQEKSSSESKTRSGFIRGLLDDNRLLNKSRSRLDDSCGGLDECCLRRSVGNGACGLNISSLGLDVGGGRLNKGGLGLSVSHSSLLLRETLLRETLLLGESLLREGGGLDKGSLLLDRRSIVDLLLGLSVVLVGEHDGGKGFCRDLRDNYFIKRKESEVFKER